MKRPVSLVASLLLALGMAAACSGATVGKTEVAGVCNSKMGSAQGCACLADALEKNLTPEEFTRVAKGIDENKRYSSDMLPSHLSNDAKIGEVFAVATTSCFV